MKNTKEFIEYAKETLKQHIGNAEAYHSVFDFLIEERLMELEPELMKALTKLYINSGMPRWYA